MGRALGDNIQDWRGMPEWVDVTDTSADLLGSSGAGTTLRNCPSKGKGSIWSFLPVHQAVSRCWLPPGREGRLPSALTRPGEGLNYESAAS